MKHETKNFQNRVNFMPKRIVAMVFSNKRSLTDFFGAKVSALYLVY